MNDLRIRRLALAGLLAAAVILLTTLMSIPMPSGHGFINLGDAGVLLAALVLGGGWGALCGGLASALSDVLLGFTVYAPATLVIKGCTALLAGALYARKRSAALAFFPAALLVPAGYFLYEALLYGVSAAALNVPLNLVQCLAGALLAQAVALVLQKTKIVK